MIKSSRFLSEIVSRGVISAEAAARLREGFDDDFAALMHLVRANAAPRKVLGRIWGDTLGVAFVDLKASLF
ncbi:hypothetical protein NL526_28625, partial [Klebsiella pneumoniae]|nr:hypothetical protein [Klebsiella pneumoniae]